MGAIERLIQQKKFDCEYEKANISLIYTANLITQNHQDNLKQYGITPQQYNSLRILRGQYPNATNLNLIKDRLIDKNSDASRLIERLRKLELVERVTCQKDRRAVDVKITQKGLDLLAEIDYSTKASFTNILKPLKRKEVTELNQLLDTVLSNFA